jgi:hypothetical protein
MPLDSRLRGNDGLLLFCNRYQEIILDSSDFRDFSRCPDCRNHVPGSPALPTVLLPAPCVLPPDRSPGYDPDSDFPAFFFHGSPIAINTGGFQLPDIRAGIRCRFIPHQAYTS